MALLMARRALAKRKAAAVLLAAAFVLPCPGAGAFEPRAQSGGQASAAPLALVVAGPDGEIFRFPAEAGDMFTLGWVHSVEEEAWEETFRIGAAGAIEIHATRFKTYGAGVPSEGAETTRIEDGWVVMDGIDRIVDPLAVLATPQETYRLTWKDRVYDLTPDGKPRILTFDIEG
ncbi:DUF1850 domain-containing protein [Fulvimarina sp. 2208YS6-2-32]|uniref:DUF1850 domain-containing protein n=1 Tax=Fulvimarina uroteuthidis TaxID=3098149 RepID=A0ABU5I313_9HYPH|nr:DUF1850 domain-containing protein [Fulvimarina sp. 2208YS6-2-32]MDY8109163.1 DUF1850 domain-containing protein [Fulvimarina sp. 2208YS6-2-32]